MANEKDLDDRIRQFWADTIEDGTHILYDKSSVKNEKYGGQGRFYYRGDTIYAHKLAWMLTYNIPLDRQEEVRLRRLCKNRACVNPSHYVRLYDEEIEPKLIETVENRFLQENSL